MPNYKPLLDRVLIKQDPPKAFDDSGFEIPLAHRKKPNTGIVVEVGPGLRYEDGNIYPPAIQKGQRVMFASVGGSPVEHAGEEHLMMREQDVFLVVAEPTGQDVGKGIRNPQFCVAQCWCIANSDLVVVTLDVKDSQTNYKPQRHDRFQTHNSLKFRVVDTAAAGEHEGISLIGEGYTSPEQLKAALQYHEQNRVPVAFIGPAL